MKDLIITVSCLAERGTSGIESNVSMIRFHSAMNHVYSSRGEVYLDASELPIQHVQFTGTPEEIRKAVMTYVDDILTKAASSL